MPAASAATALVLEVLAELPQLGLGSELAAQLGAAKAVLWVCLLLDVCFLVAGVTCTRLKVGNVFANGQLADATDVLDTAETVAALASKGVCKPSLKNATGSQLRLAIGLGRAVSGRVDTAAGLLRVVNAFEVIKARETFKVGFTGDHRDLARVAASRVDTVRVSCTLSKADGSVVLLAGKRRAAAALFRVGLKELHQNFQVVVASRHRADNVLAEAVKVCPTFNVRAALAVLGIGTCNSNGVKALGALGGVLARHLKVCVVAQNIGIRAARVLVTALATVRLGLAAENSKLRTKLNAQVGHNGVIGKDLVALRCRLLQ